MLERHPNLSDQINNQIAESELNGGVWINPHPEHVNAEIKAQPVLPIGSMLRVRTKNTLYTVIKLGEQKFAIHGHHTYCPVPTLCKIHGSTFGGAMLKIGFIGRGMHLEFSVAGFPYAINTTEIQEITEVVE
ncbi:MAG: hypothetical protein KGL39_50050 [Patescibacteria group bacterium]|nr:hypothetical protein [Patescibacteria group bacterium]